MNTYAKRGRGGPQPHTLLSALNRWPAGEARLGYRSFRQSRESLWGHSYFSLGNAVGRAYVTQNQQGPNNSSNGHYFFFFGRAQVFDLLGLGLRHFLELVQRALLLVFADLFLFF
jgi:hypothetical protein